MQLRRTATAARCRRDSSTPPAAAGRSAARAGRAAPRASRSRTPAGARSRCADRSHRPAPGAARACSRRTAPAAAGRAGAFAVAPRRVGARRGRAPAAPATSRRRRCGAAAAAARARSAPSANRCARSGSSPRKIEAGCAAAARARPAGSPRLTAADREPRPRRGRVQDQLARDAVRLGEDGAQALVPRHQVAERGLQRRDVERAREPHRQRDGVGARLARLPAGRGTTAAAARTTAAARPGAATGTSAGRAACACVERARPAPSTVGASNRLRIASSTSRAERMRRSAASPAASARPARRSCRRCRPARAPAPRRTARTGSPPAGVRGARRRRVGVSSGAGSALRSSLPLGVSGSGSSTTNADGTMYSGSARRNVRAQRRSVGAAPVARHHVGHQPLVAGLILARHHRRLRHAGMPRSTASISPGSMRKPRIFTWSSARPRNSSSPSGAPARQVAGAVHPAAGRPERVGHEPLRRQPGRSQIAARQPGAGDVQLAGHAGRHRLQAARPARRPGVRQRPADRRRRAGPLALRPRRRSRRWWPRSGRRG